MPFENHRRPLDEKEAGGDEKFYSYWRECRIDEEDESEEVGLSVALMMRLC